MKTIYRFEDEGGKTLESGKEKWPHTLHLVMTRKQALEKLTWIANQLGDDEQQVIDIPVVGKIEMIDVT